MRLPRRRPAQHKPRPRRPKAALDIPPKRRIRPIFEQRPPPPRGKRLIPGRELVLPLPGPARPRIGNRPMTARGLGRAELYEHPIRKKGGIEHHQRPVPPRVPHRRHQRCYPAERVTHQDRIRDPVLQQAQVDVGGVLFPTAGRLGRLPDPRPQRARRHGDEAIPIRQGIEDRLIGLGRESGRRGRSAGIFAPCVRPFRSCS